VAALRPSLPTSAASEILPIPAASSLLGPWKLHALDVCPWPGFWGFNASIHRDRHGAWRCSVRCADYNMSGGRPHVPINGKIINRNILCQLHPDTLEVMRLDEMKELHIEPVTSKKISGLEDLRLFETEADGLLAISTAMQFNADNRQEIVLLELDGLGRVIDATPLRGMWSKTHQKNWTPYDGAEAVRLLYSVERGGIHDGHGMIAPRHGEAIEPMDMSAYGLDDRAGERAAGSSPPDQTQTHRNGSLEIKVIRRHPRMAPTATNTGVDTGGQKPFAIRGGTQLQKIGPARWIGIGHGMRMLGTQKFYWHVAYSVDDRGVLRERSEPFKLAPDSGIEFAAGLAFDREHDRAVISFGVDDESAWLGECSISALVATLRPISAQSSSRSVTDERSKETRR
jgi:hypothetical protein